MPGVEGKEYITCFDPSTGVFLDTLIADDKAEIERKIHAAAQAQLQWKDTSFAQRRRVVRSLNKWLVENQEVCARVTCRDTGKTSGVFRSLRSSSSA